MSQNIYVHNGFVSNEPPKEGESKGIITLPVSDAELLQFFSRAMVMYSIARDICNDCPSEEYITVFPVFEAFEECARKSGCLELFESYYNQHKEIVKNGKKS